MAKLPSHLKIKPHPKPPRSDSTDDLKGVTKKKYALGYDRIFGKKIKR